MNQEEFLGRVFNREEAANMQHKHVLVALSGGADSVALLRVLLEAGFGCYAAHCNFHLRGEESMRDERFVRELCKRFDVPLAVKDFDVTAYQQSNGGSVEMACRKLRYDWFEQERQRLECDVIAVAHHADDQVETFFLNLLRGTGLRGLSGMRRLNGHIWRPLLEISRKDILGYLSEIGQDYVTDSTNAENDYRRNRLRNLVLPVIEQQFPRSRERILNTMANLANDRDLISDLAIQAIPDERHIQLSTLCNHPDAPTLLYHRLRHLGFNREQCQQAITAALLGNSGRQFTGAGYTLYVNRKTIDIENSKEDYNTFVEIPIDLSADVFNPIKITVSHNNAPFSALMCDGKNKVAFDTTLMACDRIVLRHWREGDRIRPYGMHGSKLVSDLFNDLKLDHNAKTSTWLLEADGDILWVLGHRASALYPVKPGSQDYLMLQI